MKWAVQIGSTIVATFATQRGAGVRAAFENTRGRPPHEAARVVAMTGSSVAPCALRRCQAPAAARIVDPTNLGPHVIAHTCEPHAASWALGDRLVVGFLDCLDCGASGAVRGRPCRRCRSRLAAFGDPPGPGELVEAFGR